MVRLRIYYCTFWISKGLTDYFAGTGIEKKKKVLLIGALFYVGGVLIVILLLLVVTNPIAQILLPLASGFIGAGEGFFFAGSQILLSNYSTGKNRGRYLGLSEFSIYGGYTIGSLTAGFLTANQNFVIPYGYSLAIVFLTVLLITKLLLEKNSEKESLVKTIQIQEENQHKKTGTIKSGKKNFKPTKLLRNKRILTVLLVNHFSKWGDALILLLPVYFAYIFSLSSNPRAIVPDTVKIGFLLGLYTATWAIGMFITSYITEMIGRKTPIFIGLLLSGMGFVGLSLLDKQTNQLFIFVALTISLAGIGTGLYYPLLPAVGLDIAKPKYQGQTLALFRTFRDFGYFTGPLVLILIVYMSGSSISSLPIAILSTGVIMILLAGYILITLRETRPIWPFFEEFVQQVELIQEVVKKSVTIFNQELMEDEKLLQKTVKEAKTLEQKADKKKRQLYKELILPMGKKDDVEDFKMLIEQTDNISNQIVMAGFKYSRLNNVMVNIPKPLLESLRELAGMLPEMMDELLESILLLNERVTLSLKNQKKLSEQESEIDTAYGNFLHLLYQFEPFYPEGEKFTIMMTLKESSELIEKASDIVENIGDTLAMIAWKHRL